MQNIPVVLNFILPRIFYVTSKMLFESFYKEELTSSKIRTIKKSINVSMLGGGGFPLNQIFICIETLMRIDR